MKHTKNILTASILTLALFAPAALAGGPVQVNVNAAGLDFVAAANHADMGYKLSVTGPAGFFAVEVFENGTTPYFDAAGLEDGSYNYELTALLAKPAGDERGATGTTGPLASGAFVVKGGTPVDPDLIESVDEKAQVFNTDLIVAGSACVGFDCTSSESFGFDTIRVKENNLRIHFDDTSSSASFPNNDWRLQANDSSNGGANYFSIEDASAGRTPFKVEAGAPTNTLYAEDDGDVGVGTSNPVTRMHLVKGDSPALRLEQDGSSGFTPQTWDLSGNETNFFIRDVTNGSKLPFRIKPGAADNAIFIDASSDVGLGTDSPSRDLHVRRSDASSTEIRVENTNATTQVAGFQLINSSRTWNVFNNSNGDLLVSVGAGGIGTVLSIDGGTGAVTLDQLSGGGAESTLCVDNDGTLCRCGSC